MWSVLTKRYTGHEANGEASTACCKLRSSPWLPGQLTSVTASTGAGGADVRPFEYLIPESVDEAIAMRLEHGDRSRFIAGGTELVVMMKAGKLEADYVIELSRLAPLRFIQPADRGLSIGPLVTHAELERSPLVQGPWMALAEASASIREPQVKNLGTIGGNIAFAVPSADTAPPLLTLDAVLTLRGA